MESKIFNLMSQKTLQRRRFDRKPPTYLCLNGTIRYRLGDLKAYLENCIVDPQHDQKTSHVHE